MKKVGIVRFLGTNCDRDIWQACEAKGYTPEWLWYENTFEVSNYDAVIIPGGFSYGDYLRCGAMASKTPVMSSVIEYAQAGKPVLGICNGFQILCEVGLLPGALVRNHSGQFIDKWVELDTQNACEHWGAQVQKSLLPIAHGEGCYHVSKGELENLQKNNQIWLTYASNPNGSVADIAGVLNEEKNVAGLMPHPERALFDWMGGQDGFNFF